MSRAVYRELQGLLNVLQALTEILQALAEDALKSLSSAPTHTPAITVTSTTTLSEDLQDLVYASAELCNTRFSKALVARNDAHASNLSLPEFVVLFKESWAFVLSCEVMCKRMIVGLRGVLVGQSKAFLANFHRKSIERSSRVVEEEQWTPAEIPRQSQAVVDRIVEGAMADPKELIIGIGDPSSAELSRGHTAASGGEAAETSLSKTLNVEDHTYHAVGACLSCLDMLQDYLKIVINITLLTTDCMSRIVEFLKVSWSVVPANLRGYAVAHVHDVFCIDSAIQLSNMSAGARSRCTPFRRSQEHHCQTFGFGLSNDLRVDCPHSIHPRVAAPTLESKTNGHAG